MTTYKPNGKYNCNSNNNNNNNNNDYDKDNKYALLFV